jgi:uncharacterized protein YbcV (DUF1398 family)
MHKYEIIDRDLIHEDMVLHDLKKDRKCLYFAPKNVLTDKFYLRAIDSNLIDLIDVPNKFLAKVNYPQISKLKRIEFDDIPKEDLTFDICLKYFYLNDKIINKIPLHFLNEEFYYEIVWLDPSNISFVPEKFYNLNMIKRFFLFYEPNFLLSDINYIIIALNKDLVRKISYKIYAASVLKNGLMIYYIPVDCRTKNLCIKSIKSTKFIYTVLNSYFPRKIVTFKFLKIIFEDDKTYKDLNKSRYKKNLSYNYF